MMAAAVVYQAAAGAVSSRPSPSGFCAHQQRLLKQQHERAAWSSFVKFLPAAFPLSSSSSSSYPLFRISSSHRVKELPWAAGNSESSLKNLRARAITEVAETAATALRLESDAESRGSSSSLAAAAQSRTFEGITTEEG